MKKELAIWYLIKGDIVSLCGPDNDYFEVLENDQSIRSLKIRQIGDEGVLYDKVYNQIDKVFIQKFN